MCYFQENMIQRVNVKGETEVLVMKDWSTSFLENCEVYSAYKKSYKTYELIIKHMLI